MLEGVVVNGCNVKRIKDRSRCRDLIDMSRLYACRNNNTHLRIDCSGLNAVVLDPLVASQGDRVVLPLLRPLHLVKIREPVRWMHDWKIINCRQY